MSNTNTGENAFIIARTALEASFGIMRVLAKKGLIDEDTFGQVYAAALPERANASPADNDHLLHHCQTRLAEIKKIAKL